MSNVNNKRSDSMLPKITVVVAGNQKINQDYKNLKIIQKQSVNNIVDYFNEHLNSDPEIYQMFLSPQCDFLTKNAISLMMAPILDNDIINGAYADSPGQYFPAYNYKYFNHHKPINILFNTLLLCKNIKNIKFKNIELYYHEFFYRFAQTNFIHHVAYPLIKTFNKNIKSNQIKELCKCLEQ